MLEDVQCDARTRCSQRVPVAFGRATFLQHNILTNCDQPHYFVVIHFFIAGPKVYAFRQVMGELHLQIYTANGVMSHNHALEPGLIWPLGT